MPELAPELSVGNPAQTNRFLFGDRIQNATVLDRLQFCGANFAALAFGPRVFQLRRTKQAADVVGSKGWSGSKHTAPLLRSQPKITTGGDLR